MNSKKANWFEVSVKYRKIGDDGIETAVSEIFAVDAVTFAEAEKRAAEEASTLGKAVEVKKINPAPYREVYFNDLEDEAQWFKPSSHLSTLTRTPQKRNAPMLSISFRRITSTPLFPTLTKL